MGQVNNVQLKINLKANNNRKSDYYGKLYGYTDVQNVLSTRGLCEHISNHGTIYTRDIVQGVLTKLCECIPELVGQGVPVKLDGIGIFYPTAKNVRGGLDDIEAACARHSSSKLHSALAAAALQLLQLLQLIFAYLPCSKNVLYILYIL